MHRMRRGSNKSFHTITVLRKIWNHPELVFGADGALYISFLQNGHVNDNDTDSSSSSEEDGEFEHNDVGVSPGVGNNNNVVSQSCKLEVTSKILPLWKRQVHRVLISTQWTKILDIVERFFCLRGWEFCRMGGEKICLKATTGGCVQFGREIFWDTYDE